jgi:hypothetical protein
LHFVVRDGNAWVFGKNINKRKMEVLVGVVHFLLKAFNYFYIAIWYYVKLEDVLEVFPMLIPKYFLDQFVFIWGCEQCSKTFGDS